MPNPVSIPTVPVTPSTKPHLPRFCTTIESRHCNHICEFPTRNNHSDLIQSASSDLVPPAIHLQLPHPSGLPISVAATSTLVDVTASLDPPPTDPPCNRRLAIVRPASSISVTSAVTPTCQGSPNSQLLVHRLKIAASTSPPRLLAAEISNFSIRSPSLHLPPRFHLQLATTALPDLSLFPLPCECQPRCRWIRRSFAAIKTGRGNRKKEDVYRVNGDDKKLIN